MKYAEINRAFTEITMEYMKNGYTINTATMRGSQGECGKIDLTDGREIIRIMIVSFTEFDKDHHHYDGLEIVVGRDTSGQKPNMDSGFDTIWNNKLEIISRDKYYEVGSNRNDSKWYGTKDEAWKAEEMRYERYKAREAHRSLGNKTFGITAGIIVLPKIRAMRGCKGAKAGDIKVEKKVYSTGRQYNVTYIASYNGKIVKLA